MYVTQINNYLPVQHQSPSKEQRGQIERCLYKSRLYNKVQKEQGFSIVYYAFFGRDI